MSKVRLQCILGGHFTCTVTDVFCKKNLRVGKPMQLLFSISVSYLLFLLQVSTSASYSTYAVTFFRINNSEEVSGERVQFAAKDAARGEAKTVDSSSAHSAPMSPLLDPCSHFDVAMVPTTMARENCRKTRHRPDRVPVVKAIDFWTHCPIWTTLGVDILHYTGAIQSRQW